MTIFISTQTKKISYRVDVSSIRSKMKEGILTRKNLQMAAIEYVKLSLDRRIPNLLAEEDYNIRFKGLYT